MNLSSIDCSVERRIYVLIKKPLMKLLYIFLILATITISSCEKSLHEPKNENQCESFMPLQIGNYWRVNEKNYSEIQDTVRIKGKLFYKVYSLVGGDVKAVNYYRIDENQNLISSSPQNPDHQYLKAKFGANVGESFQTIGDKSYNDYKVTVLEKTSTTMTFSFDMIYHPSLKGQTHTVTYLKGLGWKDIWIEIKVCGKVYKP